MRYLNVVALCLFSLQLADAKCAAQGSFDDAMATHVTNVHNIMRSWAAEGELYTVDRQLPPGENIYAVEWDCKLEELAIEAVKGCPTQKKANPTNGQSFQHYPANADPDKLAQPLNSSMNDWLDVADTQVDIENEIVVMNKSDKLANFFNMVRANTLYIGCSEMKCGKGKQQTATAACFYSQPDLKDGDLIYKAGKNCTGGGYCSTYQPSRCDFSNSLCVKDANGSTVPTTLAPVVTTLVVTISPGAGENNRCPQNGGMKDAIRYKIRDMHNYRRKVLADGEITDKLGTRLPRAANMMYLRYNCQLESDAFNRARQCILRKSDRSERPAGQGENHAAIPLNSASGFEQAVEVAVKSWWKGRLADEIGKGITYLTRYDGQPAAYFTQMAWATTRKVGCAVVRCQTAYNVVCRYTPRGNHYDRVIYNRGKQCTQCPSSTTCSDSLCTSP